MNKETLLLAEGLLFFHLQAPKALIGKTLARSGLREKTGCTVVDIENQQVTMINPDPATQIDRDDELILVGTFDAENSFLSTYSA